MKFPVRPTTAPEMDCVWIMVCPDQKQDPYLMSVPASAALDTARQHLISIAPDCDSPHYLWDIDTQFTFEMQWGGAAGVRHILYGLCNEEGMHTNLKRNDFVSEMLKFAIRGPGVVGPFAFVLMRIEDAKEGGDNEVPIDIDSYKPLSSILERWRVSVSMAAQKRYEYMSPDGVKVVMIYH